jgi:RNA polymerase sigma-70 factor (ECF subfamily)
VREQDPYQRFNQVVVPHLDAAYNLARWITRRDQDAEDMVQEACLRAFRFLGSFRDGDSRAWVLTIVRNTCYTWLRQNHTQQMTTSFDEAIHDMPSDDFNPERVMLQRADVQLLQQSLEELPVEFREMVVLRDLEGLSYKEIAHISGLPIGTVMSRLARGRKRLQQRLADCMDKELDGGL